VQAASTARDDAQHEVADDQRDEGPEHAIDRLREGLQGVEDA